MAGFLSVTQAASEIGVTRARVLVFINDGRLAAQKIGKQYMIKKSDLAKLRIGKPGRPKKSTK